MIADNSKRNGEHGGELSRAVHPTGQLMLARPQSQHQDDRPQTINPTAILNALRRSWKLALPLGLCLAVVGSVAGWFLMGAKYAATAYLQIDADDRPLIFETADQISGGISTYELYKNTQSQLMVTPFVLNAALRDEKVGSLPIIRSQPDPVDWLREELKISFPARGEIMEVSLETDSSNACVVIVNAVVTAYMDEVVVNERNQRLHRLDNLERVYTEAESKVRNKRAELKSLASALGTGDSESLTVAQQTSLQQFGLMQEKLSDIQFDLMQTEGELKIAQEIIDRRNNPNPESAETGGDQPANAEAVLPEPPSAPKTVDILRLEDEIAQLEGSLMTARKSFGDSHPTTERLQQLLEVRQKLLDSRVAYANEQAAIASEQMNSLKMNRPATATGQPRSEFPIDMVALAARIDVLKHHEGWMQQQVDQLKVETKQLGQSSIDVELMRSEIEGLEDVLKRVGAEMERTSIEMRPRSRIEVISPAERATPPDLKKRIAAAVALGIAGLFAPFGLFVGWDLQRGNVNDSESVSTALAVSTFGTIPRVSHDPLGKDPRPGNRRYQRQRQELGESVDSVAAMILHHVRTANHQAFMVTSALAGEGKSTVACQLAESLSRSGKQVALVDFDLRRPSIDRYLGLEQAPGVAEVLANKVELKDALQQTESPNLSVLVAGMDDGNLFERSTSSALQELFEELRDSFDVVIVDACPVLPVADARITGTYCDGVILTLIRDVSRLPAAGRACEMLKAYGVKVLGTVVIGGNPSLYYRSASYTSDDGARQSRSPETK